MQNESFNPEMYAKIKKSKPLVKNKIPKVFFWGESYIKELT